MTEIEHVIVGTAGHIDHGKTLLVKALTGIDAAPIVPVSAVDGSGIDALKPVSYTHLTLPTSDLV